MVVEVEGVGLIGLVDILPLLQGLNEIAIEFRNVGAHLFARGIHGRKIVPEKVGGGGARAGRGCGRIVYAKRAGLVG